MEMIQPQELRATRPIRVHGDKVSSTSAVWAMLSAAAMGDLKQIRQLVDTQRELLTCQYDYTSPLHLAIREGHIGTVRYLVAEGALDPAYRNHPFLEPLLAIARDRGLFEIATLLERSLDDASLTHEWGDTGGIERNPIETQQLFQELVDKGKHEEVAVLLKEHPEFALNDDTFWGEGVLAMPAKDQDREMLELLMRYGARVPDFSKWGARYYFKHYETAAFLLERGMNPNHMNWRRFTLLHDMAFTGDARKAALLLDHGAEIDAIDDEYQSTPLGYAAHFGRQEVVELLLARGANATKAGAEFATPLNWAERKGHTAIVDLLLEKLN